MKLIYRYIGIIIMLLAGVSVQQAYATHLVGGYMSYEFLRTEPNNNKTFKISLTLFRDMEQSDVDFDDEIEIGIYLNNAERSRTQLLSVKLLKKQVVHPPGSEECDYYADKRIQMGYYERTVTLAPYPQGYHVYFVRCCRNIQDNLKLRGGDPVQGQTYYCFIPNPALENSSPFFSGVPSPYMCDNDTNTFLNRAIDPDGDSLVYRFVHPFQGGDIGQSSSKPTPPQKLQAPEWPIDLVDYNPGYNEIFPFGTGGYIDIDQSNGLTSLMSPKPGSFVIAIEVEEFRNGVSLGTVRLDMQILVLRCPPNKKPVGSNDGGKYMEVEAGEQLCFNVYGDDPDNNPVQNVTISGSGDILTGDNGVKPPLATMKTEKAPGSVQTRFCWTPSCDQARDKPYKIAISAQDDGCPPKYDNYNIEIKVKKFIGSKEILGDKRVCASESYVYEYRAKDPKTNSTFYWEVDNGVITSDNTGDVVTVNFSGSGTATVRMVEISQFGCPGDTVEYQVTLIPTPDKPVITGDDTVCLGSVNVPYNVTNNAGSTYKWILPEGTIAPVNTSSVTYSWNQLGDYTLSVIETNSDGCSSDTGKINVNVRKPVPGILGPVSVCPNAEDIVYWSVGAAGSTFDWTIVGGNQASGGNTKLIKVDWGEVGMGSVSVQETDRWGCVSGVKTVPVEKTYNLKGARPMEDTSVCEFDADVPYWVIASNGSVYDWTIAGGSQVDGDSSSNIKVTWGATGQGSVSVQQKAFDAVNGKECLSPVVTLDVDIHPIPTANEIEGDFDFCQGNDERSYTVNGFTGSTYHWEINGSDKDIAGQGTNTISVTWPDAGNFSMKVTELSKDSCPGETIDTIVVVHPKPTSKEILGDYVQCTPNISQTVYRVNGFPNSTYTWTVTNGNYVAQGDTSSSITIDWDGQGFGEITVVEVSEFGCVGDTLELPVYINDIKLDLERVSVGFPDDHIIGEFRTLNDNLKSDPFTVERRAYGTEVVWSSVAQEHHTNFIEKDINTDVTPFEYRIVTTDLCGNKKYSEVHRSILLSGYQDPDNFSLTLTFTPYIGWDNGVNHYELYRSVNSQQGLTYLKDVDAEQDLLIDGNSENYRQCFRVLATEEGGLQKKSWSNEICFFFSPNVFTPTAFTPNKDNLNETYHPVCIAVKDYKMQVYNRWGEKIFETDDQNTGWDGTYSGADSPAGVYMFIVEFSDYEDKVYRKAGTFHLIR